MSTVAHRTKSVSTLREAEWIDLVKSAISGGKVQLPLIPTVATKVMALVQGDQASVRTLGEVILKDPVTASQVLKLANTVLYGSTREVTCLSQAIVRMGFAEVRNVVVGLGLRSSTAEATAYGGQAEDLHSHAIGVAYAAQHVAHACGVDANDAFMAGLFHDIGKLMLLKIAWDLRERAGMEPPPGAVDRLIERSHAWAGGYVLRAWCLPAPIEQAVCFHHEPSEAKEHAKLAHVVCAANRLCNALGIGGVPEGRKDIACEDVFARLRLGKDWIEAQLESLPKLLHVAHGVFAA